MVSKCLNSHCSATFRYLGQGRLFRVDFTEMGRKRALAGKQIVPFHRSPIEHFWLCKSCAATMTIEIGEAGEVRLVPFEIPAKGPAAAPTPKRQKFVATAS